MAERRRFKQTSALKDRLIAWSEAVRKQAEKMKPGPQRDLLLKKASMADTAAHLDDWISSRELQPPK